MPDRQALPAYRRPPVNEVIFTLRTRSAQMRIAHVGLFWARVRDRLPGVESRPPIGNATDGSVPTEGETGLPWVRTWLISEDQTRLVQVQQNRVVFNWRHRDAGTYPRYEQVRAEAFGWFEEFERFHLDASLGPLQIDGAELSYINHLKPGLDFASQDDLGKTLPFMRASQPGYLGTLRPLAWLGQLQLPDDSGILRVQVGQAVQRNTGTPVCTLELTAQAKPSNLDLVAVRSWFEAAHIAIVRTFADITDQQVQVETWGRIDDA